MGKGHAEDGLDGASLMDADPDNVRKLPHRVAVKRLKGPN